jgi:hypothetical protein
MGTQRRALVKGRAAARHPPPPSWRALAAGQVSKEDALTYRDGLIICTFGGSAAA